ncbi:MAG: hypothetical protein U5L02_10260 [Rheinheimera sp.]|nr:hypothetical protein [Rheinheimera sp.]
MGQTDLAESTPPAQLSDASRSGYLEMATQFLIFDKSLLTWNSWNPVHCRAGCGLSYMGRGTKLEEPADRRNGVPATDETPATLLSIGLNRKSL